MTIDLEMCLNERLTSYDIFSTLNTLNNVDESIWQKPLISISLSIT
jgi:hypothetical protein